MTASTLAAFEASLKRCEVRPNFLDVFYGKFLSSSPEVAAKFAGTDIARQKEALRSSFHHLLLVAKDPKHEPDGYLRDVAARHGPEGLAIGAHLYDLWLDALLETVRTCDPECYPEVEAAWEEVMMIGIHYLCAGWQRKAKT